MMSKGLFDGFRTHKPCGVPYPRRLHNHLTPTSIAAHTAVLAWANAVTKASFTRPSRGPHPGHGRARQYRDDLGSDQQLGCNALPRRSRRDHDSHRQQLSQLAVPPALGWCRHLPASASHCLAHGESRLDRGSSHVCTGVGSVLVVPLSLFGWSVIFACGAGLRLGSLFTSMQTAGQGRKHQALRTGLIVPHGKVRD